MLLRMLPNVTFIPQIKVQAFAKAQNITKQPGIW